MPTIANHSNLSQQQAQKLVRDIQPLRTVEEVVHWGLAQPEARMILEVVVQDEYCHDVIIAWERGLHLVFDTT